MRVDDLQCSFEERAPFLLTELIAAGRRRYDPQIAPVLRASVSWTLGLRCGVSAIS